MTSIKESLRNSVLDANRGIREGRTNGPRRLDEGEVTFRIPDTDYPVLLILFPDLASKDHAVRLAAWKQLRHSPVGEKYLVTRTPRQVKANQNRIIVK